MVLDRLGVGGDAAARRLAQLVEGVARELPVVRERPHIEVHRAVGGHVGMSLADQRTHHLDHLRDVLRRARQQLRPRLRLAYHRQAELLRVDDERGGVEVRDRVRVVGVDVGRVRRQLARFLRLEQAPRGDLHLVLAAVGVVLGHVPHVGHVHHLVHLVPGELERAAQDVGVEKRPEVPDVRVVVDRRPARVERDEIRSKGLEGLDLSRERVVELQGHVQT